MNSPRMCMVALYVLAPQATSGAAQVDGSPVKGASPAQSLGMKLVPHACTNPVPLGMFFPLCCAHYIWLNHLASAHGPEGFTRACAIQAAAGAQEATS